MLSDPKRRLADASEVTAEHFRVLYRKGTAGCLQRAGTATTSFYLSFTPRECPANPNCLFGLLPGPDAALPSARAEADALRREIGDDPRTLLRAADVPFAGLQNLGSTCFMGSLLQVLFANRALRIAVFEWGAESASAGESATRNEVMEQLRRLFAEMQLTARTHVSPESFLRSLNLPLGVQQDAAEFHKLLMQLIEDRVEKGRSASAKKLFHGLFEGKLAYSTTCCTCLAKSETSDRFSELKVPLETGGSSADKGLRELLLESLREEVLPDRECDKCHRKAEAKRKLSVASFPQQLVIELLHFTFDPASQSNKKVTRFVPIPEELDLASLCTDPRRAPPSHFTLAAVVCHIGQSANSGHYVSYVFDSDASCWWRFDDSIVRRCDKFPSFCLACTTAGNETPYILFYHREDCPTLEVPHLPPSLASPLQKAAEELRTSSEKYGELERTKTDEFRAFHQQLIEISKAAEVSPDEVEYNWISASWLRRFAQSPFNVPPIDNTPLLCPHGGVAFGKKKVLEMKRISRSVWNLLVGKYGGGPELTGQSECATCVQEWVKHRHAKEASMEEKKRLDYEMRPFSSYSYSSYSSEGTLWVAKSFVQKWSSSKMLPETLDNPTKPITCPHGKLCADDSLRTRVSDAFWRWLKKHYDSKDGPLVEFLGTALPCSECQRELEEDDSPHKAPESPTRKSSVADVCRWLESIGLSALVQAFTGNDIDGRALFELAETDLPQIGVASFGHRKSLLSALRDLQQPATTPSIVQSAITASVPSSGAVAATPPTVQASTTTSSETVASLHTSKFGGPASEPVIYKGKLELPALYKPQGTCAQELLAARVVLGSKVPQLEEIVKEVGIACRSILGSPEGQELVRGHGLTEQEVFAITAYTYDLGLSGKQSENLYFQLNELLRRRVAHEMRAVMGYLYFILGALRKLPAFEGTVFRGSSSPDVIAREYTTGREIFWSGFTSTTTDLSAALGFAGRDGVVFRIKINSGRSIAKLSLVQSESEVLLPPNACLMVFSEMHREADGVQYVDLVEKKDSFRW